MKSYNGLFSQIVDEDCGLLELAVIEAAKNKKVHRADIQFIFNLDDDDFFIWIESLRERLVEKSWKPSVHEKKILQEGSHRKQRIIQKPNFVELVVQHALMIPFRPLFLSQSYRYSLGSIPGGGPVQALDRVTKWRDQYQGKDFYVAELDIKKFYQNIDLDLLKCKLSRLIRDKNYLDLLFKVIDSCEPGLPLGYYTSPWLGNFYLFSLDNHILHDLKPNHYLRYLDNLYLMHENKEELHKMVQEIIRYCAEGLHLTIKQNWQVFKFEYYDEESHKIKGRAINLLGYVVHRDRVGVRKSILERIRHKANKVYRTRRCKIVDARTMMSYRGYFLHSNAYRYYVRWIQPKLSFRMCKIKITLYNSRAEDGSYVPLTNKQKRAVLIGKKKQRGRYYP